MTTSISTRNADTVATRYYGGRERGLMIQMEIAECEFPAWADEEVQENEDGRFEKLSAWLERHPNAHVLWDCPSRQNLLARQMHEAAMERGGNMLMEAAAEDHRQRAKALLRLTMRVAS